MASTAWRVELVVPAVAAEPVATALEPLGEALSAFELAPGGDWRLVLHSEDEPDRGRLAAVLALAGLAAGVALPEPEIAREIEVDWMARLADSFPAIRVGRFHLHGSHLPPGPPGKISLLVDAATAFGSGEHQTTRGCLQALDRLGAKGRRRRPLDVGTGTGVLAFAAAKLWRVKVRATDLDAESVRVARANARRNGVAKLVRIDAADGLSPSGWVGRRGHDLVFANILANPLTRMARPIRRALAPGGVAILSGLLARQERQVLAAYRRQGLRLERRIAIDGWHTLVLRR
ncbi:50S ribosomal protein L11 methyltransferase [Stella sp.]|uniref:50S ribosomal protein L11 methyltransferase n=1 Tax=Stella sp. TaxID=2912054 RepID=UPI0035AE9DB3